jgi:tetratricopeptide (TPR) repeat protein
MRVIHRAVSPSFDSPANNACLFCADGSVLVGSDLQELTPADPDVLRQFLSSLPLDAPEYLLCVLQLSGLLDDRFRIHGASEDLDDAIMYLRNGISFIGSDSINLPHLLHSLGSLLRARFDHCGERSDLDEAVTNYRRVVELTPVGHNDLPSRINILAFSLASRFAHYREDTDLEQAIANYRQAIKLTPVDDSDLSSLHYDLAISLASRFSRYGDDIDLDQAIVSYRQTIEHTPVGDSDLPSRLNDLALSLNSRFTRYGEDVDLAQAIENYRQAIELTPVDHGELPLWLNNLAASLQSSFDRYGEDADLKQAIANYRKAIELTRAGDSDLPSLLNNLANSLHSRFRRYGEDEDLEQAIANHRQGIALTPIGHSDVPYFLNNLATSLESRFTRYRADLDLDQAITNYRQAIELTPVGCRELPSRLTNLASALEVCYTRYREDSYLKAAISQYARGSEATGGETSSRFLCAVRGAALAHSSGHLTEALNEYSLAASLLPQLVWFGQSVSSRQERLRSKPANLASDAAACAISLGYLERAVELLDHGRSILWSQAMDVRTDLADLKDLDASLAEEFENVARALDTGTLQDHGADSITLPRQRSIVDNTEDRRRLADRLEHLLLRIRELQGFQNFMQPAPFSRLRYAAAGGPVIILNVSSHRCDALIVTVDFPPKLVPLPDLSFGRVSDLAADVRKHQNTLGYTPQAFRSCLKTVLPELWRTAVLPVLSALGCTDAHGKALSKPRIWWCPTGPLSFLPIHAAGPYTKSAGPSLPHRVVSSYTNTLSALLRSRSPRRPTKPCRMLLIGQADTPGQKPLLSAVADLDVICERARSNGIINITRLEGPDALQDTILEKLKSATCVHFACHGHQDQTRNGLISALYVHDKPLLLPTLASRQLSLADFAFLSACHSASGSQEMPDEAMHIAAGMQVAGFRSIIATMWAMDDRTGPFVADEVYGRLLRNGPVGFDSTEAAASLNDAVCALRKVKDERGTPQYELESWVPFIHIGV